MGISLVALEMFCMLTLNCMLIFNFHVVFKNVLFLTYTVFRLAIVNVNVCCTAT